MRQLITVTILLLLPNLSFGYAKDDPNLSQGFSDQAYGGTNTFIGTNDQPNNLVNALQSIMSGLSGSPTGTKKDHSYEVNKQYAESLPAKDSKGRRVLPGGPNENDDDSDVAK